MLRKDGTIDGHGECVQVSRLGNPLINEVVIPLGDKDYWNRVDPADDSQFEHYYSTPEVSRLENLLYGTPPQGHPGGAHADPRRVAPISTLILLTGVPGLNFTGTTQADLLRLNTAIKPGVNGACPEERPARLRRTGSRCSTPTCAATRTAAASSTTWSTSTCGCSRRATGRS